VRLERFERFIRGGGNPMLRVIKHGWGESVTRILYVEETQGQCDRDVIVKYCGNLAPEVKISFTLTETVEQFTLRREFGL
jgi:hypothetical protein